MEALFGLWLLALSVNANIVDDVALVAPSPLPAILSIEPSPEIALVPPVATSTPESVYASCVRFLRVVKGLALPRIAYAKNLTPNIKYSEATIGDVIIFSFAPHGHLAQIIGINKAGWVVDQANKRAGKRTQEIIEWDNPFIVGFYRP